MKKKTLYIYEDLNGLEVIKNRIVIKIDSKGFEVIRQVQFRKSNW